ncbi:MAG: hypothetical protein U0V70_05175 [Terriglobia bacterium]
MIHARRLRLTRFLLLFSLVHWGIPCRPEFAQEPQNSALSQKEILSFATANKMGQIASDQVLELIHSRGLDFPVTDDFLSALEKIPADSSIIDALRKLKPTDQGPDSSTPLNGALTPTHPRLSSTASSHGAQLPDERSWPEFLEKVRYKALAYSRELPNFICTQITTRSERESPGSWHEVDNVVAELSYFENKENYKLISVADRPAKGADIESLKGSWSTGEFGTSLLALFHPQTKAKFSLEVVESIKGHHTVRIGYQVPKETSSNTISYGYQQTIVTPYRGQCWIDPESYRVVRLEEKSFDIPLGFPVTQFERTVEYKLQEISGEKYWLPVQAEMLMVKGANIFFVRNVIQFKKYRKYEAAVKIVPE